MEFLTKNNINNQNFSLFIRDLSESLDTNLKHVIEDTIKDDTKKISKKHKKKADIIREQQNIIRWKKLIDSDYNKIKQLYSNKNLDDPFYNFKYLKTDKGIEKYKFLLLKDYWEHKDKNKYLKFILTLYFSLKDSDNSEYISLLENIGKKLEKYEYKLFMMKELGYLLPPLNFWDNVEKRLEIYVEGPHEVTAKDIICDNEVLIVNEDKHIATVTEGKFRMIMTARRGIGYVNATLTKNLSTVIYRYI